MKFLDTLAFGFLLAGWIVMVGCPDEVASQSESARRGNIGPSPATTEISPASKTVDTGNSSSDPMDAQDEVQFSLNLDPRTDVVVDEGASLALVITMNKSRPKESPISVQVRNADNVAGLFPNGSVQSVIIPAQNTSGVATIKIGHTTDTSLEHRFPVVVASTDAGAKWQAEFTLLVKKNSDTGSMANSNEKSPRPDQSTTTASNSGQQDPGNASSENTAPPSPPLPALVVQDEFVTAGDQVTLTIQLSPASATAVSVDYATVAGSAAAGADFMAASGTLSFAPGETSKTVSISTTASMGRFCSTDKTFSLELSNAAAAELPALPARVTISEGRIQRSPNWETPVHTSYLPSNTDGSDGVPYELGMRFKSSQAGKIIGLRFIQAASEGGSHVGKLWDTSGNLLASVNFATESGYGIRQARLSTPVHISAGQEYIVSVNVNTHLVLTGGGLSSELTNGPLSSVGGGLLALTAGDFPTIAPGSAPDYFRDVQFVPDGDTSCEQVVQHQSLFPSYQVPQIPDAIDSTPGELAVRIIPQVDGEITAIRFLQAASETGSQIGRIWSDSGNLLAAVNFANQPGQGWRQAELAVPLVVIANTAYVVSVSFNNAYPASYYNFAAPVLSEDLKVDTNGGIYTYSVGAFPSESFKSSNYFRDVIFRRTP